MPRCKKCKDKFIAKHFLQKYCMQKDECAKAFVESMREKNKKDEEKEWNEKKKELKVETHYKENKKHLQDEINKLSRMIDEKFQFNCIDCGLILDKEKNQVDACHFISRGSNSSLKYHLDILHAGHNHCNVYNPKHESNYKKNLEERYGIDYIEMINDLPLKYKEIHLTKKDISEKLKLVRSLVRNFNTYKLENSRQARTLFNKLIGIYV